MSPPTKTFAIRASNARSRKKATAEAVGRGGTSFFLAADASRERYTRRLVLLTAPAEQKPRIKALIAMGPPDPAEVKRLVREFLAWRSPTVCPTRAGAEIRNGDGFE